MTTGAGGGIDAVLAASRDGVRRLTPAEVVEARARGVEAWIAAGLPLSDGPADVRE